MIRLHHQKQKWHFALKCLFLLMFTAGCTPSPPPVSLRPDAVILAFGDSVTQGVGASKPLSYPAQLQTLLGQTVINAGISGETSDQGLNRLPGVLEKHRPAAVILCHGGNDFLRAKHLSTEANLEAMIKRCEEAGARVILLGVPRPNLLKLRADPLYERLAKRHALHYLPNLLGDALSSPTLRSDPIHPNAEGYRLFAEALAPLFKKEPAS